ncbi:zinc finger protein [Niameybacter massiliensis]|uniref:zinc finger protein n=1 Tax=Niameybacter massiliensis TaxID=1658108 RepID=UPI0012B5F6FB|nr:zinc finger protein [Niameybacter massiliensis]
MFGKRQKAEKEKANQGVNTTNDTTTANGKIWVCPKCKTENKRESLTCRMCGTFK